MKKSFSAILVIIGLLTACNPNQSGPTCTDNTDTISVPVDTVVIDSTNDTLN